MKLSTIYFLICGLIPFSDGSITWYEPPPIQTVPDVTNPVVTHKPNNTMLREGSINASLSWNFSLSDVTFSSLAIFFDSTTIAGVRSNGLHSVEPGFEEKFVFRWISSQRATLIIYNVSTAETGGLYSCQVLANKGFGSLSWRSEVQVDVVIPPSITHISSNQTVTEGQNVRLNCTASGSPAPIITWTRLSDNITVTLPLINIRRHDEGVYRCTAHNGIGGQATIVTYIIVHYLPKNVKLNMSISGDKVCAGNMVHFTCEAGAANPEVERFRLYRNDTVIANMSSSGVSTLWLNTGGYFLYKCNANNSVGTGTSNSISVTVEVPVRISANLITGSNTPRRDEDVALYCNASGFPEPSITWSKVLSNTRFEITSSHWLNFTNIKEDKSGMYICQANNTCGKRNSSVISIKVLHKPENVTLNASVSSGKVCAAKVVKLTCNAGAAEPKVDNYTLYQNDTVIANRRGSGVFTLWLNTSGHFSYLCEASNSEGTGTSNNITFAVKVPALVVYINDSIVVREGENATLFCDASGFPPPSVSWVNVKTGVYKDGAILPLTNLTDENQGDVYKCVASNECGNDSKSTAIDLQHAPENIMLSEDSLSGKVCAGNVVQFTCKAGAANPQVERYTLYRNNTVIANMGNSGVSTLWLNTSGLYIFKCKATNSVGVGTSNSITFTVEDLSSVTSVSPRTVIKEGEDVTLFCNVTGDPAPKVFWVDARNQLTNSGATWKLPKISRRLKGEYICVASNACGSGSKTTTIDVQYPPSATDSGQNKTVRTGTWGTLSCPVDGNPQPSITWYKEKDAGGTVLSRGKELKFFGINSGDTGCYTCSASNGLGKPINITQCLTFETSKVSWRITLIITNKDCKNFPEEEFRVEVAKLLEHLGLNSIETKTRCGSVIVDLGLGFNQSVGVNDLISTLKDAASDGKFGDFNVDSNSIRHSSLISTSSPSPTNTEGCNCSCNTVLGVIIGILVAIIIVLIIIIVWQNKKGTTKRPYEVPPHDAGFYDNGIAMEDISPTHVSPSSSTQKLSMSRPGYMDLQEVTRSDKYRTDQSRPTTSQQQNPSQPAEYAPLNLRTRSWEVARDNVTVDKIIGKGAFGQVAKGTAIQLPFSNGKTTVAVKMLKPNAPEADKKDLLSELELMKTLKPHPHIIKLMGCVTLSEPLLVLIEYVPYGDLLGYLRKSRGLNDTYYKDPDVKPRTSLTSQQLMKFAWQIADGMSYLSSRKIIHRDLAARNVLVGERETCKVTDFGMARDVQQEDIYEKQTRGRLPVKWTAYESLLYGTYTTKSDVWSYGVILYEIFTIGGSPYPRMDGKRIANALQHGYRMPKPQHVDDALYQIMMNCWQKEPEARPSFPALTKQLKEMEKQHKRLINMHIYDNELYGNLEDLNV